MPGVALHVGGGGHVAGGALATGGVFAAGRVSFRVDDGCWGIDGSTVAAHAKHVAFDETFAGVWVMAVDTADACAMHFAGEHRCVFVIFVVDLAVRMVDGSLVSEGELEMLVKILPGDEVARDFGAA